MVAPNYVRALLLNLGVFTSDNNVRRSVGAFSSSYITANSSANIFYQTINPADTYTWTPPTSPSSMLVIQCTKPLLVNIALNSQGVSGNTDANAFNGVINQLFVCDDDATQLVFQNPSSTDAVRLTIIQG